MARQGKLLRRVLLALAVAALVDGIVGVTWLGDGRVGKRPLPPFGELDAEQRAALERLAAGTPRTESVMAFDRELGWCVRPGAVHSELDVHVDATGLRGTRSYAAAPPPGVVRLACFGDSFTFGDEVRDDYTYQAFLEAHEPRVEALNFGVPAYGTDQALLRLSREGLRGARVAVLSLLLENIGRNVNRWRPLWTPRTLTPLAKPRFVLEHGALRLVPQPFEDPRAILAAADAGALLASVAEHEYWLGRPAIPTGRWSSIGRLVGGFLAYRERDPERLWNDADGEPRRVTLALVDEFRRVALARGAERVLVLVLPMREELARFRATGRSYWSALPAELATRDIDALDLAPALAAEDARCEADPAHPTLYVAAHLSSHGNQVIALEILAWLGRVGLLEPRSAEK